MKTTDQTQALTFVLKDGHTQLATWTLPMDPAPHLYQSVPIPDQFHQTLQGYEPHAKVTRIEVGKTPPVQVDLEAVCLTDNAQRPIIVLNLARIGDQRKSDLEAWLRTRLACPLIYWETSPQPQPVLRFFDPVKHLRICPAEIQTDLLQQLTAHRQAA